MLKRILKILAACIGVVLVVFIVSYVYIYKNDVVYRTIKDKGVVSFSVLLYDTDSMVDNRFDSYQIMYDCKGNLLKILCVNIDAVVLKKREKAKSLKTLFYENQTKDLKTAIDKFYLDLYEVIGSGASSDCYINMSFKIFNDIFGDDKNIKSLLMVNDFETKDLELLNSFEIIERVLHLAPYRFFKFSKNYKYINTNIPKMSFVTLMFKIKKHKPEIMFCEMPVRLAKTRIEPNKKDIEEFLDKIYYSNVNINEKDIVIDVKNASRQPRMAEKATWLLRDNKFDVLDWGSFPIFYDKTIIKDYRGSFKQALNIGKILRSGKVIVSYNSDVYADINVFIGKDCKIYDNLDKKGDNNGKH